MSETLMLRFDPVPPLLTNRSFLLTAPGTSALATVRVVGPGVVAFLRRRFSRRVDPGGPTHGVLRDDRGVIDDPVVVLRAGGLAADLTLHGGAAIARCVIALAEADGFARSPVDVETVGSTDALATFEHEVLASLPRARTELAARALLAQQAAWTAFTRSSPDADTVAKLMNDRSLERLLDPPSVALVGLPNAGKSTLANALFGQQRSIVSDVAGTTRDWVGEEADLDGLIVRLMDTPGLRETNDPIERAAIAASGATIGAADAVVLVIDAARDDAEQAALIARFPGALLVANKWDVRLATWEARRRALGATETSARSGDGVDDVLRRLKDRFGVDDHVDRPRAWTARQRGLLAENRADAILT